MARKASGKGKSTQKQAFGKNAAPAKKRRSTKAPGKKSSTHLLNSTDKHFGEGHSTSDYAVHIAATWPGVPASDVTPDELVTLLRDRLADGKECSFRFKDAKFEFEWSNRLNIRSMVVEVIENGKVTRKVHLVENCGYLQDVKVPG